MKLKPGISGISFIAVMATLFLQIGDTNAQPQSITEECTTRVERVLHLPGDSGFDELATRVDNLTSFGPGTAGAEPVKPAPAASPEYIRLEYISDTCAVSNEEGTVARKAENSECSHIECQVVFPGNNMLVGARMNIESCGNRVETIRNFKRVGTSPNSMDTDGIWQLTAYNTRTVSACPGYQEP